MEIRECITSFHRVKPSYLHPVKGTDRAILRQCGLRSAPTLSSRVSVSIIAGMKGVLCHIAYQKTTESSTKRKNSNEAVGCTKASLMRKENPAMAPILLSSLAEKWNADVDMLNMFIARCTVFSNLRPESIPLAHTASFRAVLRIYLDLSTHHVQHN